MELEALRQRLEALENNNAQLIQEARNQRARAEKLEQEAKDAQAKATRAEHAAGIQAAAARPAEKADVP